MILIAFIAAILSFPIQANPNYVFDLSGSFQGFGDVVGVWSAFYGVQKSKSKANYIAIIDSRAKEVLQDTYKKSLDDISKQFHVQFYADTDLERVPKADIYFQLFFGGRRIKIYDDYHGKEVAFYNPVFCTAQSVVVISDTMHGRTLDEAFGSSFHFYFSPPGIGSKRSGILNSTDLDRLVNMAPIQQQELAASLFPEKAMRDLILRRGRYHNVKLSFIYGSHNETFSKNLMGQTKDFIHALESYNTGSPVVIFSPHKLEKLQEVLPGFKRIWTLQEFEKQPGLENKVYVLQLPPVTNLQFSALIAIADLPILLEGNNAISQAIRLQKEFLVMRSPWNAPQIEDLISVDSELGGPWIYPGVYDLSREAKPYFDSYFHHYNSGNWHKRFFQKYALSESTPDFVGKLIQVINLSEILKDKPVSKDKLLAALKGVGDPYLVYSAALTAQKEHVISLGELSTIREDLTKKGFAWKEAEKRFTPNRPGFSRKIEVIGMGAVPPKSLLPAFSLVVVMGAKAGLANRIKSIASGLTMAKLSSRTLCLAWEVNKDMPAQFHDLFENDLCILQEPLPVFTYEKLDLFNPSILKNKSDVLLIDSYKSFSDPNVKFSEYLGDYIRELNSLKPTPDISARVSRFVKEHFSGKRVVGVHFRSWSTAVDGPEWSWLKSNPIESFFAIMDEELKRHPETKFFIATDSQENKDKFIKHYQNKIIVSAIPEISRNSVAAQIDGFFEWLLLGKTEFVIGTNASSYSDEAALLTIEQRKINVGPNQWKGADPLICFDPISGKPLRCGSEVKQKSPGLSPSP